MKKFEKKRQWYSRLLLCMFVPMLLLASVHIHQQPTNMSTECYACLHHIHHDGHLSSTSLTIDSCLLCHFLTTPYVAASIVSIFFAAAIFVKANSFTSFDIITQSSDVLRLRAPPVYL